MAWEARISLAQVHTRPGTLQGTPSTRRPTCGGSVRLPGRSESLCRDNKIGLSAQAVEAIVSPIAGCRAMRFLDLRFLSPDNGCIHRGAPQRIAHRAARTSYEPAHGSLGCVATCCGERERRSVLLSKLPDFRVELVQLEPDSCKLLHL